MESEFQLAVRSHIKENLLREQTPEGDKEVYKEQRQREIERLNKLDALMSRHYKPGFCDFD